GPIANGGSGRDAKKICASAKAGMNSAMPAISAMLERGTAQKTCMRGAAPSEDTISRSRFGRTARDRCARLHPLNELEAEDMSGTAVAADFVAKSRWEDCPPTAVAAATRAIIDCLGVMLAGAPEPPARIL